MTIKTAGVWMPISDEAIVDLGLGSAEDQANAARRLEQAAARREAYWRGLPWHVRAYRTIMPSVRDLRWRLVHAARALRGIDCECD